MPTIPFFVIGFLFIGLAVGMFRSQKEAELTEDETLEQQQIEESRKPESLISLLQIDPIELEIGYSLIPLVDESQGGDMLERISMIRRQAALDLGLLVPVIRIRDNLQLNPDQYVIKIKGVQVGRGELMVNHYLAMDAEGLLRLFQEFPPRSRPLAWMPCGSTAPIGSGLNTRGIRLWIRRQFWPHT